MSKRKKQQALDDMKILSYCSTLTGIVSLINLLIEAEVYHRTLSTKFLTTLRNLIMRVRFNLLLECNLLPTKEEFF